MLHELIVYWINFIYLACFLGAFAWYGRLVLAAYHITYLNYGIAIIEALVLAKLILIGDFFRLGQRAEKKPLLWYPTLYNSVVFTLLVAVFNLAESVVRSLFAGKGLAGFIRHLQGSGKYELLAGWLVTFVAFVPFFAFKELSHVLGKGRMKELFFGSRKSKHEPFILGGTTDAPAH